MQQTPAATTAEFMSSAASAVTTGGRRSTQVHVNLYKSCQRQSLLWALAFQIIGFGLAYYFAAANNHVGSYVITLVTWHAFEHRSELCVLCMCLSAPRFRSFLAQLAENQTSLFQEKLRPRLISTLFQGPNLQQLLTFLQQVVGDKCFFRTS